MGEDIFSGKKSLRLDSTWCVWKEKMSGVRCKVYKVTYQAFLCLKVCVLATPHHYLNHLSLLPGSSPHSLVDPGLNLHLESSGSPPTAVFSFSPPSCRSLSIHLKFSLFSYSKPSGAQPTRGRIKMLRLLTRLLERWFKCQ